MQNPKVSVIVPVYNGEKFIQDTLLMLLRSSLYDIEIIVIDDGSEDSSISICKTMAEQDSRIRVYYQQNTGVFGARNHGLKVAEGYYICFCDQDDVVEPTAYEKMYLAASKYDCEVVMSSTGKLIGEKKESFENLPDAVFADAEVRNNCMLPILYNGTNFYSSSNAVRMENDIWKCMIKREFILENNLQFRHIVNYEDDFLFLLDILARARKVATISDILYYWRINLGSETYHTAYVENLYRKDIALQNEIVSIMQIAQIDKTYIERYEKCQNCNRYIHMIENENRNRSEEFFSKIRNVKIIREESAFVESLHMRKGYKGNLIHRKIILGLLEHNAFAGAYLFHKCYAEVREKGLHFRFWTKIENVLYNMR